MAAKRPRSGGKPGKPGKSRRSRRGFPLGRAVLAVLTMAGGLYVGVQAHVLYRDGRLTLPTPEPEKRTAAPARAARSEHPRRERVSGSRTEVAREPEREERARPAAQDDADPVAPVEISRGAGHRPEIALTFDAGADWKPVRQILRTLAEADVRCTFFLTGEWVERNPKTTRAIVAAGHEIGNHSWDHPDFTGLNDAAIADQLDRTEAIVRETARRSTRPYFRPPLGARDHRVRQAVADRGYVTIYWSLDSRDSVDKGITSEQVRERVLTGTEAGSIVLQHCGSQASADALPEILQGLKERGLNPVTISRLLQQ
jgi:peptidoglycan/xylan/chitin deacetylase (PgdA/CDA1 family)